MFFLRKKTEIPFRAYSGSEPFVFVSYSHSDSKLVYHILAKLNEQGINIWYDEGIDIGSEWPQSIADNIVKCTKFVLFISPASIKSRHVRQEITFANSRGKQILPIYLKPSKLNAGLEMTLSVYQAIFMYAYKNNEEGFYDQLRATLQMEGIAADDDMAKTQMAYGHSLLRLDEYGDQTYPQVIHLPEKGKLTIGRFDITLGVKQSDFEFSKDKKNISRRHAVFERSDDGYTLTDLGSKSGTWVNGRRLPAHEPQQLEQGCHVVFGNSEASYIFEA